MNIRNSEWFE